MLLLLLLLEQLLLLLRMIHTTARMGWHTFLLLVLLLMQATIFDVFTQEIAAAATAQFGCGRYAHCSRSYTQTVQAGT